MVTENKELEYSEKLRQYADQVKTMSKDELQEELKRLDEELEDEETEMRLLVGQTGVHLNAKTAQAYRESFDRAMMTINEQKRLVNEALGA